jgi:hypothetical protein
MKLISNKHLSSISYMKCRYVGGKYMHFYDRQQTRYVVHVFLHLMGSVGHIVHSSACVVRNVDALFLRPGGIGMDSK